MDYDRSKDLRYKADWLEQTKNFVVATLIALFVAWMTYFAYCQITENREAEKKKFVTTVVRDGANPCRITVVRKNATEAISYSAILEGCKQ